MRRSDLSLLQHTRRRPRALRSALPEPVYRQTIGMLFGMALPVLGLALAYGAVASLAAITTRDPMILGLLIAGLAIAAWRLLTILAFRRAGTVADAQLRGWERRYALGSFAFALLLAAFNIRVLCYHDPLLHLVSVSLVFGYGAGIVSRISVRPAICVTSLVLAVAPTVIALLVHAASARTTPAHLELYLVQALLLIVITALSLQTVAYLHRATIQHLIAEHDLTGLAKRDPLTGLANRLLLREHFEQGIAEIAHTGAQIAVHCIDLDGFKAINDTHGHPIGDAVLREVASRLRRTVRNDDSVARLGGDEFVVIQTHISHGSEAELLARRLIRAIREPYQVEHRSMKLSASIGIAMTGDLDADLERTLARADEALYRAKNSGKSRARLAPAMRAGDRRTAAA